MYAAMGRGFSKMRPIANGEGRGGLIFHGLRLRNNDPLFNTALFYFKIQIVGVARMRTDVISDSEKK